MFAQSAKYLFWFNILCLNITAFLLISCGKGNSEAAYYQLYLKGKEAYQKQDLDKAEKLFADATGKDPKLLNAKLMLAKVYYHKKNLKNAMDVLNEILESDNDHINGLYLKARIMILNPEKDPKKAKEIESEAIKSLNRILEIDSHHIPARLLLALLYEKNKLYKEAIYEYKAALEGQATLINARANLGILYKRIGLIDKSREEIKKASKIAESAKINSKNLLLLKEEIEK